MNQVLMPQAGQSMEEGTVLNWLKAEGDAVKSGEPLLEVETDKAVMEVQAEHDGILRKILVAEKTTVPVRTVIALIGDANEPLPDLLGVAATAVPSTATPPGAADNALSQPPQNSHASGASAPAVAGTAPAKASPAARKIAAERGLDLAAIGTGSGPGGRITSRDLSSVPLARSSATPSPAAAPWGSTRRRMSSMRKAIVQALSLSKQTIPHFYMQIVVDATSLTRQRQQEKASYPCSINDFITRAVALAVREFPAFRTRIEGDELVTLEDVNIGIAVGMDEGLVVPVLLRADTLALKTVAAETGRLAQMARSGRIENMGKGSFTISNLGMFGIEQFAAIINPPESAILAVGAIREEARVRDGAIRAGQAMTLTLSADHRIIDGLPAAQFMARLRVLLEKPSELL